MGNLWKKSLRPQGQFPSCFLINMYGKSLEMELEASRASAFSSSSKTTQHSIERGPIRNPAQFALVVSIVFQLCFHCFFIVFSLFSLGRKLDLEGLCGRVGKGSGDQYASL